MIFLLIKYITIDKVTSAVIIFLDSSLSGELQCGGLHLLVSDSSFFIVCHCPPTRTSRVASSSGQSSIFFLGSPGSQESGGDDNLYAHT
jgi:hypothetical protein